MTRAIAQELQASLNPVREAIRRLAAEGLVDHIPGAGAFVRKPDSSEILAFYELREALEPFAAAKAATRITEPELQILQGLCEEEHRIAKRLQHLGGHLQGRDLEAWFLAEEDFHTLVIRAARNSHFDRTIGHFRVLAQLFQGHQQLGVKVDLAVAARTWSGHVRLVRALSRRDDQAAAEFTRKALRVGAQTTLAAMGSSPTALASEFPRGSAV